MKKVWINLILAPLWFLLAIVGLSVYYSLQGFTEVETTLKVSSEIASIILIVQVLLLVSLIVSTKKKLFSFFAIQKKTESSLKITLLKGIALGSVIAVAYIWVLSPIQYQLQVHLGDIIPPGKVMDSLGSQIIPFFIANIILAPFVEETLYRGYSLSIFRQYYSTKKSILLSAMMFGLLHWTGGIWYVLMTGLAVGLPFAMIASKEKNIQLVFVAHLTLNLIEFLYIVL